MVPFAPTPTMGRRMWSSCVTACVRAESLGRRIAEAGIHGRITLLDVVTLRRCERVTSEQVAATFERRLVWGVVSAFLLTWVVASLQAGVEASVRGRRSSRVDHVAVVISDVG